MNSAIHFHAASRAFSLRLARAVYSFRVLPDGQLVHTGFAPLPAGAPAEARPERPDAYEVANYPWEQQGERWEFPAFGDISYHDYALKAAFPALAAPLAPGEAANLPVRDVRLRYESHDVVTDAAPLGAPGHGLPTRVITPRETLRVRLRDAAYPFTVTLHYRVTPEHDILERWVELANHAAHEIQVQALDFGVLHLPGGRCEWTRAAGSWCREFSAVRQPLEQGTTLLEHRGMNSGHHAHPAFLASVAGEATEESGRVWFGLLAWSGNWSLRAEALPTGANRIYGGYERGDYAITLPPGATHTTPAFLMGCCEGGRGGASRRLHRFIRERVVPHTPGVQPRPVLYNGWEAVYFDLTEENQIALARQAAALGVELFCIDDGWFGARRHDRAGLGDWRVSPEIFPRGLAPVVAEVRRLGMKFGLWVEPEMVNPDSDLHRAHPDWVLHFPGRPRTEARQQLLLDLGRPEVRAFLRESLHALVRAHGVDYLKWDMNRYATEPGSVLGTEIWRAHVLAVYELMDGLRREFPRLLIQTCSGGGGRADAGILARTDWAWISDNTDAHDRAVIQDGYSLYYPPATMEAWVTHEKNHQTGRLASLKLRFDAAMRGVLGIGTAINRESPESLELHRQRIAFYKRIRAVVHDGDLYRLSEAKIGGTSSWLHVVPDASRAVYSTLTVGQPQGIHRPHAVLRGLDAAARYALTDADGREFGEFPGWQLMSLGLPGDTAFGGYNAAIRSRTVLLERV